MQHNIRSCVTNLAEMIDEEESHHSSSSLSPLSSATSGSRKSDLSFDELHLDKVPEELCGPKNWNF